jgi:hypothetical protein
VWVCVCLRAMIGHFSVACKVFSPTCDDERVIIKREVRAVCVWLCVHGDIEPVFVDTRAREGNNEMCAR